MALLSTFISNPVKTIIAYQAQSTSTAGAGDNNIAGGPTYLISAKIANTNSGSSAYTKLYNLTAATAGTDTADVVLLCTGTHTKTYTFHPPLYFSNGISMVTTSTKGQAGTTAPGTPPAVTLILSSTAS